MRRRAMTSEQASFLESITLANQQISVYGSARRTFSVPD